MFTNWPVWFKIYGYLIFPILLATLVVKYGSEWSLRQVLIIFIIAFVLSAVMYWTLSRMIKFPKAQPYEGMLTLAGLGHVLSLAGAFTVFVFGLLYLNTPHTDINFWVLAMVAWLWVHMHISIGLWWDMRWVG